MPFHWLWKARIPFLVYDPWSLVSEQAQRAVWGQSFLQSTFESTLSKQLPSLLTPKSPPLFSQERDFEIKVIFWSALLIPSNLIFLTNTLLNCIKRYLEILNWLVIYKNYLFPNSQAITISSHINMTLSGLKKQNYLYLMKKSFRILYTIFN